MALIGSMVAWQTMSVRVLHLQHFVGPAASALLHVAFAAPRPRSLRVLSDSAENSSMMSFRAELRRTGPDPP